jgi:hypothetical protein
VPNQKIRAGKAIIKNLQLFLEIRPHYWGVTDLIHLNINLLLLIKAKTQAN